jgi:hypothetical protein
LKFKRSEDDLQGSLCSAVASKRMYQPLSAFTTMVFAVEETIIPEVVRYLA